MSRSKEVIRDAGGYALAIVLTQIVTVVSAVLMRRFLGPAQVGVWALVQMVLTYAEYSQLGTMNAITREVPYYRGRGDEAKSESIKDTVFTFGLLTAALGSAAVLANALLTRHTRSAEVTWGLCIAAVILIPLHRLNGLLTNLVRALKRFDIAGRQMVFSSLVNAALVAALSYRFRFYGFLAAMCLSLAFNFVYLHRRQPFRFRPAIRADELRSLMGYGLPFLMLALVGTLFDTIDRIMITAYMGLGSLGIYSIALMTATYIHSIPNAISVVMVPNLHEIYGKSGDALHLRGYLFKSDLAYTTLVPVMTGLAWFLMPWLVRHFLPDFLEGILAMRLYVLGVFFLAVGQAYAQFIYVVKKHLWLIPVSVSACALAWFFNSIAIRSGWGITGVAAATVTAMLCHYMMLYLAAAPQVMSRGECARHFAGTLGKFTWMCALLFALDRWVALPGDLPTALAQTTLYLAAYVPFLLELNHRFALAQIFKARFFKVDEIPV